MIDSLSDCSIACDTIPLCVAYLIDSKTPNNCVLLKSFVRSPVTSFSSTLTLYFLTSTSVNLVSDFISLIGYNASDSSSTIAYNADIRFTKCGSWCLTTAGCVGYVLDIVKNNGYGAGCWLKSSIIKGGMSTPDQDTYFIPIQSPRFYQKITYFTGSSILLYRYSGVSLTDCSTACDNVGPCVGYSVDSMIQSTCFLHSSIIQSAAINFASTLTLYIYSLLPISKPISYLGCFADSIAGRALSNIVDMSVLGLSGIYFMTACQNLAIERNASYFGMGSMSLCSWGPQSDVYGRNGVSINCDTQCGPATQVGSFPKCGSSDSIDVYAIGTSTPITEISMNQQYLYRGCFLEGNDRVLPLIYGLTGPNYLLECLAFAKNSAADFFGLEFGHECFTGLIAETLTKNAPQQLESRCNYDCGFVDAIDGTGLRCGGSNAISNK